MMSTKRKNKLTGKLFEPEDIREDGWKLAR